MQLLPPPRHVKLAARGGALTRRTVEALCIRGGHVLSARRLDLIRIGRTEGSRNRRFRRRSRHNGATGIYDLVDVVYWRVSEQRASLAEREIVEVNYHRCFAGPPQLARW